MSQAFLEHANVTVSDPDGFAALLCDLFDWKVRWRGAATNDGLSVHVGGDGSYVALYSGGGDAKGTDSYQTPGGLNHLGVVVSNLDQVEKKVKDAGYTPHSHADYAPGCRFYFDGPDGVEIEVVSYANGS